MKENILHSLALSSSVALFQGGGYLNLGIMFWAMAMGAFTSRVYGAFIAGLVSTGLFMLTLSGRDTDTTSPFLISLFFGMLAALAGLAGWTLSQKFVTYIRVRHSKLNVYLVVLALYFGVYSLLTSLLQPLLQGIYP